MLQPVRVSFPFKAEQRPAAGVFTATHQGWALRFSTFWHLHNAAANLDVQVSVLALLSFHIFWVNTQKWNG